MTFSLPGDQQDRAEMRNSGQDQEAQGGEDEAGEGLHERHPIRVIAGIISSEKRVSVPLAGVS